MLVKTHGWSDDWAARRAQHVLLTHRDLRAVVASYRRMGWAADLKPGYVAEHLRWRVRIPTFGTCLTTLGVAPGVDFCS